MFSSHRWKWFVLAFLMSASVGCAHSSCASCGATSTPSPLANCSCISSKVINVVADPSGVPGTYIVIPSSKAPAPGILVNGTPSTLPQLLAQPKETPTMLPPTKLYASQPGLAPIIARNPQIPQAVPNATTGEPETKTSARYDHSKDYTWVMGKLEYLYSKKVWRVRFVPAEVEDDLGGCVTLVGVDNQSDNLKDGQMVRVDGVLVDPESRQIAPEYQVHAIKPMD